MNQRLIPSGVLMVCVFVVLSQFAFGQARNNTISGHVFGITRQPLTDVYVELLNEVNSVVARVKTTSGGRYFFGGLSGNQGALRSAFLIRANLSKEAYIATGVVIACMIDISRLSVYSKQIFANHEHFNYSLIIAATLSAFIGAYVGNKLLKKITVKSLQVIVAIMLFVFAILLIAGFI